MDTLKRTPEHVESDFGESIISRDEALSLMAEAPGLGPPDLCWLQKTAVGLLGGAGEPGGYYHWTVGRDISSSAAIAAFFASLSTQAEQASFIQGLFTTSEYKIQRGFYCAYDPFSRMDIRCELCVPGGVECKALDTSGSLQDVPDNVWGNLQVRRSTQVLVLLCGCWDSGRPGTQAQLAVACMVSRPARSALAQPALAPHCPRMPSPPPPTTPAGCVLPAL
jgi:hypothetical protein